MSERQAAGAVPPAPPPPPGDAPEPRFTGLSRRAYLVLGAVVFLVHMAFTGGHLMSPDGELLYRQTESLALRGSITVRPLEYIEELGVLAVPPDQTFATVRGPDGAYSAQYLPLQSVLSVPLVWLAEGTRPLFAEAFARTQRGTERHPVRPSHEAWRRAVVVGLFNPLVAALTALVLARVVVFLTRGDRRAALWAAGLWAFGTMALPHSRTYFTEPLAGLLLLVAIDQSLRWLRTPLGDGFAARRLRHALAIGVAMGLAIWTRMDSPVLGFGLGVALLLFGEYRRQQEEALAVSPARFPWRDYAAAGLPMAGAFALLLLYNDWRFSGLANLRGGDVGGLLSGGYADQEEGVQFSNPLLVGLHGYLASPGKGMLFFSPALVLALWGWMRADRGGRAAGAFVAVALLPFVVAMAKWQNWAGGWCWGPRHIHQVHAPLMIGAGFLLAALPPSRVVANAVVKAVAALAFAVQVYGASQSPLDYYHEFFKTPVDGLAFHVAYRPSEALEFAPVYRVEVEADPPLRGPQAFLRLPAPLVDSIYVPQHTQWAGYAVMWSEGYRDIWLLDRLLPRTTNPTPEY